MILNEYTTCCLEITNLTNLVLTKYITNLKYSIPSLQQYFLLSEYQYNLKIAFKNSMNYKQYSHKHLHLSQDIIIHLLYIHFHVKRNTFSQLAIHPNKYTYIYKSKKKHLHLFQHIIKYPLPR